MQPSELSQSQKALSLSVKDLLQEDLAVLLMLVWDP